MMTRTDLNGHAHPGVATKNSAYPRQLEELIEQAQHLAREAGAIPSQNKLKAALHVRSERARTVLQALRQTGFDPTTPDVEPNTGPAEPGREPATEPVPIADSAGVSATSSQTVPEQVSTPPEPVPAPRTRWASVRRPISGWPMVLLAAPAFVAIWSGWVGLGTLTGFGMVHPLPGIADGLAINSAITLPIGVETYAVYALRVWLASGIGSDSRARRFAKWSAIGSLTLGMCGQVAYHLMVEDHMTTAPWGITTAVSCLPVIVLGFGAALAHLQHRDRAEARP
ncbi:ABC transporter permease [Actinocrispum wychmicini]|uniref:Uncharacterized protein n=1 Tax=Actinocrispum wychmicini TaxID=1213861 RepID=A0A4R2IS10_9PSEU|nr:ABC transporter permease [Actinocrispum wychmicini]TCO47984.1 hypothetical protein EV192_11637 [Actinocrispum wychmicini]